MFICVLVFNWGDVIMENYMSIRQIAEKWGLSKRRVQVLCSQGRIQGAIKVDYSWVIPADAEKPEDKRVRSGKYLKNQNNKKNLEG